MTKQIVRNNVVIKTINTTKETEMTNTSANASANTALQAAMIQAGIDQADRTNNEIMSEAVKAQLAWPMKAHIQRCFTLIQNIAAPSKNTTLDALDDLRRELGERMSKIYWGYANINDYMPADMDAVALEWEGGKVGKKNSDKLTEIAQSTGLSYDFVKQAEEINAENLSDFLVIKRNGMGPVVLGHYNKTMESIHQGSEPTTEEYLKACQSAFNFAVNRGNWADVMIIRADCLYLTGTEPTMPARKTNMEAQRIRENLANRQAEQQQRDLAALRSFEGSFLAA